MQYVLTVDALSSWDSLLFKSSELLLSIGGSTVVTSAEVTILSITSLTFSFKTSELDPELTGIVISIYEVVNTSGNAVVVEVIVSSTISLSAITLLKYSSLFIRNVLELDALSKRDDEVVVLLDDSAVGEMTLLLEAVLVVVVVVVVVVVLVVVVVAVVVLVVVVLVVVGLVVVVVRGAIDVFSKLIIVFLLDVLW